MSPCDTELKFPVDQEQISTKNEDGMQLNYIIELR